MTTPHAQDAVGILLAHYERIAGDRATFTEVSPSGSTPSVSAAVHLGYPRTGALTGFTVGLSHTHSPAEEGHPHKELVIHMADYDPSWAFAAAFLADQLQGRYGFDCGNAINLGEQIAPSSRMSAFLVVRPRLIASAHAELDLGIRAVSIRQLVPLYEKEHGWLMNGGDYAAFLRHFSSEDLMNPGRPEFGG